MTIVINLTGDESDEQKIVDSIDHLMEASIQAQLPEFREKLRRLIDIDEDYPHA